MKLTLIIIGIAVVLFAIIVANTPPTPKTAFQRREAQAKHLRSDTDTATMMRLCDGLPYEVGDGR